MSSTCWDEVVAAYDARDAAQARIAALRLDALNTDQRMVLLGREESQRRRQPAVEHSLINGLIEAASPEELGGTLSLALAIRLRISRAEATRRIGEAADLGQRSTLHGQPLAPRLAGTAAAQRAGTLGAEAVRIIRAVLRRLPDTIGPAQRESAEAELADLAGRFRPEQLAKLAAHLEDCLNPDGNFTDADRARRRGVELGRPGPDAMSPITGWVNPELRAGLEAIFAKLAAPGMCNPDDQSPAVDHEPDPDQITRDTRSSAQRQHDALLAMTRALLCAGVLGSHRGLPVSIVVTTTLAELENKAGTARTGGDTALPMADVIRLAAHASHYLAVLDFQNRPLWLGRAKRCATPDQRLMLHAVDRGCTHPGCDMPGYLSEVHHVQDWAAGGPTDIDHLTFACRPHHKLLDNGWSTRKHRDGTTEWIPPPHRDRGHHPLAGDGQPRTNTYFHPEKRKPRGNNDDAA